MTISTVSKGSCGYQEWNGKEMGECGEPAVAKFGKVLLCLKHSPEGVARMKYSDKIVVDGKNLGVTGEMFLNMLKEVGNA